MTNRIAKGQEEEIKLQKEDNISGMTIEEVKALYKRSSWSKRQGIISEITRLITS